MNLSNLNNRAKLKYIKPYGEPESTNLLTYSENFARGEWLKTGEVSATANQVISPDGALNAFKITGIGSNRIMEWLGLPCLPSTEYTFSFYIKNIDATNCLYRVADDDGLSVIPTNIIPSISTTEWTRMSTTVTTGANATIFNIQITRFLGLGESVSLWGAQLEALPYATSYIPTEGSVVTRKVNTIDYVALYGAELVTNGGFDDGLTGWNAEASSSSISNINNTLRITLETNVNPKAYTQITTEIGKTYKIKCDFINGTIPENYRFRVGTTSLGLDVLDETVSSGSSEFTFISTAVTLFFHTVGVGSVIGSYYDIDNISVKEVL